jgi:hypothetical protein
VPAARHYAAIFVLSLTLLALEISAARVLSVALLSHYAFVAISLAMFGLGLGALAVYLLPGWFGAARLDRQLLAATWTLGLSAALSTLAFLRLELVQSISWQGLAALTAAYAVLAVPFFCGGIGVALLMTHHAAAIGRLYAADLLGASAGCLAVVLGLQVLPAPLVALFAGAVACATGLLLSLRLGARQVVAPALACLVVAWLGWRGLTSDTYTMRQVKSWNGFYAEYEAWNAFSRIGVFPYTQDAGQLASLGTRPPATYPEVRMIDIDGSAWTPMMRYDGNPASLAFLRDSVLYLAHQLRPATSVLIVGVGGGRDLLAARAFDQLVIVGIELNPLMRHVVDERYGDYSGRPYSSLGAAVVIDEARSRLAGLAQRFGIIQLSLIDTFALNAAGGVVFSENYLYTVEAFREYFRHLVPNGLLSVSRYLAVDYPLEVLRVLALARAAWAAEGVSDFAAHVAVVRQGVAATVLVARTPLGGEDIAQLRAVHERLGFAVHYFPGEAGNDPVFRDFLEALDAGEFIRTYPYRIDPPTDDWPFFFHFLRGRLATLPPRGADPFGMLRQWDEALALFNGLIAVVSVLAALCFLAPLLLLAPRAMRAAPPAVVVPALLYFACLGYGFMMLEIPLMQRFILFLGYPVYALAVILFALLLFCGLGSLASNRLAPGALPGVLCAVIGLALLYIWALPALTAALMAWPIAAKIGLTAALLAPIGLLLGMAYPLGIGVLRTVDEGLVPWAWGLNGALSVVASVLAVAIGSRYGFSAAMLTGVAAYALGLACIGTLARRARGAAAGA